MHSRQHDNYMVEKIFVMIIRCGEVIEDPELCTPNHNQTYPGSKISARMYGDDGALLVIHIPDGNTERVFNAFYREQKKYRKMFTGQ